MPRTITIAGLAILLVAAPPSATAQAAALAPSTFESWAPSPTEEESRRDPMGWLLGDGGTDYRYPGFYIGAATGLALGIMALGFCGMDDSSDGGCSTATYVIAPVATSAMLGMFGALVGGMFSK